ncbi:MAG TPA: bacillithiol biosynthesis deacetylase BshB1 [Longimicrobiales bacterium]|nr:bacillithiol biosynthesis deacetylase BshB1 [Longimicrobiales bacterium]
MSEPLDLLAVMAHPDDAELLCGGALIKAVVRGARVGVLDLTAGEMGSSGSAEIRAAEAARAAEIIGLAERRCAGLPDSAIENDLRSRLVVAGHLRALRPRVVVTHWKVGRHRDHRIASELVRDACFLSGLKKLDAPGAPFRPLKLVYATAFREDAEPPDFVVDVSQQLRKKLEALSAYSSQFDGVRGIGEVYPGGERLVLEQVRMQMAHYGTYIRVEYGEPFRTDEPFDVASLADLTVASF